MPGPAGEHLSGQFRGSIQDDVPHSPGSVPLGDAPVSKCIGHLMDIGPDPAAETILVEVLSIMDAPAVKWREPC